MNRLLYYYFTMLLKHIICHGLNQYITLLSDDTTEQYEFITREANEMALDIEHTFTVSKDVIVVEFLIK